MTTGIVFQTAAPPAQPEPNRTDIACFVGFVGRRSDTPLPDAVLAELLTAGWVKGPWRRDAAQLENALQLPIPVESWEAFDDLFAWDERRLRENASETCATYLGAAVRSFFARGGRRAWVVRAGDPWDYFKPGRADPKLRHLRIRALLPSFSAVGDPGAPFDPNDPRKWKGIHHLYGLPDVSLVLLPDLADACAFDPPFPNPKQDPPAPIEGFVECSDDEPQAPHDEGLARISAPRADSQGFDAWLRIVAGLRAFLADHRRDCLFVGTPPLPANDTYHAANADRVYAEADFLAFLRRVGALEAEDKTKGSTAPAASAFVELGWPWVSTRRSDDLPETLEPPDGLLAGTIASSALTRGTFRSIAGTRLPEVLSATPFPAWGLGPKSLAARLAERVTLIAREPDGWSFVSDVTTSPDLAWQQGGVSRLMASILRAARRLGEGLLFEPNGPLVWLRLRGTIEDLLTDYWHEGGLRGASSGDAFTVRCDRSTMTQNDIDNGRLVAHISVAPAVGVELVTVVLALDPGAATALKLREVA